nr:PP2C family protein-serine/threonine phosphatase [Collinsella tanakaei]
MVDDTHVAVLVADVSDKGVPAALFMMRSKAIIKQLVMEGRAPAEALARANDDLCHDNEQGMFVTVWLGVLDTTNGTLSYACAGHNPPVVRSADGSIVWLRDRSGLMLGAFGGVSYRAFTRTLEMGETLVLYTDGVTEAMDESGTCLGEPALEELVAQATGEPSEMMAHVFAGVHAYAGNAPQADDITVLCLRRTAAPATSA